MCKASKGLHSSYKKASKKPQKGGLVKEKAAKVEKPNAAELFFLKNEDVLN